MAVTFDDVLRLLNETPSWTWPVRQFRMSQYTVKDLGSSSLAWPEPSESGELTIFGLSVTLDDTVPRGTVHFEIPVPELPRGLV